MQNSIVYYLAQGIGFIAFLAAVFSFQQNTHKRIVILQTVSTALFSLQFLLLGALSGCLLGGMAAVRSFIYACADDHRWARSRLWVPLFCVLSVLLGGLPLILNLIAGTASPADLICLFPIAGMILTTFSFRLENPKYVRIVSFPSSPLWFVYNVINQSWFGILNEVFVMISILIATVRFDLPKKKKN